MRALASTISISIIVLRSGRLMRSIILVRSMACGGFNIVDVFAECACYFLLALFVVSNHAAPSVGVIVRLSLLSILVTTALA